MKWRQRLFALHLESFPCQSIGKFKFFFPYLTSVPILQATALIESGQVMMGIGLVSVYSLNISAKDEMMHH